jgi:serine protease Do
MMRLLLLFVVALLHPLVLFAQGELSDTIRQSAAAVMPSVVHIQVSQIRNASSGRQNRSMKIQVEETGSGIVADIAGKTVILTNRHVVADAEPRSVLIIAADRKILTAKKISANEEFDVAVIEVENFDSKSVVFGDSDKVQVGDLVLAIGSPFGLERSLSLGIISATNRREIPGTGAATPLVPFFQVDAAVNPGSSGGPLLNLKGEVFGLQTAIATQGGGNEGVAFVTPIKTVKRVAEQLVKTGGVVKAFVGVGFDATFSLDDRRDLGIDKLIGAKIKSIDPNGPASRANLKNGDVILTFNNIEVEDDRHFVLLVSESEIGKPISLAINRNGQTSEKTITPVEQISR